MIIVDEDGGFNDEEGDKNSLLVALIEFLLNVSTDVSFWRNHHQEGEQKEEGAHGWKFQIFLTVECWIWQQLWITQEVWWDCMAENLK